MPFTCGYPSRVSIWVSVDRRRIPEPAATLWPRLAVSGVGYPRCHVLMTRAASVPMIRNGPKATWLLRCRRPATSRPIAITAPRR